MQTSNPSRQAALSLLSAAAVRERATEMLAVGIAGRLRHFEVDLAQLAPTATFVAHVIRENYPDLQVPLHARWRHFVFNGIDLWVNIVANAGWRDAPARARAEFDLAIVSSLLDAGAGARWRYRDAATGLTIGRSEGLALATLRMFENGLFSVDASDPLRTDAKRLVSISADMLERGLQARGDNPLPGLETRAALLVRLGQTMLAAPAVFSRSGQVRPGSLFDRLAQRADTAAVPAANILRELLLHLAPMWPDRVSIAGVPLGDCWRHPVLQRNDATDKLVPFHKLSQWMAYSLIEPLERAGVPVSHLDGLTGLAEYRNGGLFLDTNVLVLRDSADAERLHPVDSEIVVEWRALTIALIDRLLPLVRNALGVDADSLSLSALLQGGTWAAGRKIARQKRQDGRPPLTVRSDGTVF